MKPKQMTFYIDDHGDYYAMVHQFGYSKVPEEWIEKWKSEGIEIIIHKKNR